MGQMGQLSFLLLTFALVSTVSGQSYYHGLGKQDGVEKVRPRTSGDISESSNSGDIGEATNFRRYWRGLELPEILARPGTSGDIGEASNFRRYWRVLGLPEILARPRTSGDIGEVTNFRRYWRGLELPEILARLETGMGHPCKTQGKRFITGPQTI
ncbi:hypothetical protein RRG08_065024 [Elysia crispata]|uniref:Uncharacterized protein n=1 Tax=Elysia crispata TaxID=231223 RepID=A0AAE1D2V9_9GAST|nr:hypothetical protein RRG08_065024 [Elysia crispata]